MLLRCYRIEAGPHYSLRGDSMKRLSDAMKLPGSSSTGTAHTPLVVAARAGEHFTAVSTLLSEYPKLALARFRG